MAQESSETRMDRLERRVEILEQLPERVTALESQIVLLRDEMRSEFSAIRRESRAGDEQVIQTLREEIRAGDEQVIKTLREEIRAGDEETRRVLTERMEFLFDANERHMRLLHEDLVDRIARMSEGRDR
jgi:predicted phage gp36 major capsid-like protein